MESCLIKGVHVQVFVIAVVSPLGLCNDVFSERPLLRAAAEWFEAVADSSSTEIFISVPHQRYTTAETQDDAASRKQHFLCLTDYGDLYDNECLLSTCNECRQGVVVLSLGENGLPLICHRTVKLSVKLCQTLLSVCLQRFQFSGIRLSGVRSRLTLFPNVVLQCRTDLSFRFFNQSINLYLNQVMKTHII